MMLGVGLAAGRWEVVAMLSTISGIFDPAHCATLRRVVPGGTLSVPLCLSCSLCQPFGSHKVQGGCFFIGVSCNWFGGYKRNLLWWLLVCLVVIVWLVRLKNSMKILIFFNPSLTTFVISNKCYSGLS